MTQIVKKAKMDEHPLLTVLPAIRQNTKQFIRQQMIETVFEPIYKFLYSKNAYGVLIMDAPAMKILQCFFTTVYLTDLRLVLKEDIASSRVPQQQLFAVYCCQPLLENFYHIAKDFGWSETQKIMSIAEIKVIREEETCCVASNRFFNPYNYKGLFIVTMKQVNEQIEKFVVGSNLKLLLGKKGIMNLDIQYLIPEDHFVCLNRPELFKNVYFDSRTKSKNQNAPQLQFLNADIQTSADLLNQFFRKLDLNPYVRYQKENQLVAKSIAEAMKPSGVPNCQLFIIERSFDPLTLFSYNGLYQSFMIDMLDLHDYQAKITLQLEEGREIESNLSLNEENLSLTAVRYLNIRKGNDLISSANRDFKQVREALFGQVSKDVEIVDKEINIKLVMPALKQLERCNLAAAEQKIIADLLPCQMMNNSLSKMLQEFKYINVLEVLQKQIFAYVTELAANQAKVGADQYAKFLANTKYEDKPLLSFLQSLGTRNVSDFLSLRLLLMTLFVAMVSVANQAQRADLLQLLISGKLQLQGDAETWKNLLPNYSNFFYNYADPKHYAAVMKEAKQFTKSQSEQYVPTLIEVLSMLIIEDKPFVKGLFTEAGGQQKYVFKKSTQGNKHTYQDEVKCCHARDFPDTQEGKERLQEVLQNQQTIYNSKEKIFFYVIGGCTPSEIAICGRNSIQEPPKLGLFNTGYQEGQFEFVMISDDRRSGNEWLGQFK